MYYVQFYETQEKFGSKSSWKIMRYKQIRRIYLASKLLLFVEIACSKKKEKFERAPVIKPYYYYCYRYCIMYNIRRYYVYVRLK